MHRGRCREHITVLPAHANGIVNALLRRCTCDPLGDVSPDDFVRHLSHQLLGGHS